MIGNIIPIFLLSTIATILRRLQDLIRLGLKELFDIFSQNNYENASTLRKTFIILFTNMPALFIAIWKYFIVIVMIILYLERISPTHISPGINSIFHTWFYLWIALFWWKILGKTWIKTFVYSDLEYISHIIDSNYASFVRELFYTFTQYY